MRALIQRVIDASVSVDGTQLSAIGPGLLILVCAMEGDTEDASVKLAHKIAKLRIFRDDDGRMNRSVADVEGAVLVVSQFTLAADTSRGNRPGFSTAAAPYDGKRLYLRFAYEFRRLGLVAHTGEFGADMAVSLTNDGPVTIWMDTET